MSSYFDAKTHEVNEAADRYKTDALFVETLRYIEERVIKDVTAITGDREFPEDLREKMLGIIAVKTVAPVAPNVQPSAHAIEMVLLCRESEMITELHSAFHELARRRIQTRFGMLYDDPVGMGKLRDEHDR